MSNNRLITIVALAVVLLTTAFAYVYYTNKAKYDWSEYYAEKEGAYTVESKEPYGVAVLHSLLDDYFPNKGRTDIEGDLGEALNKVEVSTNYFFVGEAMRYDSTQLDSLLEFVAAGNTAFISAKRLPDYLIKHLYWMDCDSSVWERFDVEGNSSDTFALRIFGDDDADLPLFISDRNETQRYYSLHFIPSDIFYCEDLQDYSSLGCVEDDLKINFARFGYGEGQFLLHSTPLAFTNFHLLRPEGKSYCQSVLNHLPEGTILWDEKGKVSQFGGFDGNRRSRRFGKSPLATLLSNKPLAWAWYLSLGLGVLYVLFKGKRRRRTIPILPKNSNTSMEFVETIAQLHFKQKNFKGIAVQRMKLFLAFLRERYGIHLHHAENSDHVLPNDELRERIHLLSDVPRMLVDSVFSRYANIVDYEPTEEMVVDFYHDLEQFKLRAK